MTESSNANAAVEQETPEAPPSDGPAQLREAKERADARAEQYRTELVKVRLADIGLNADEGLGIAVAEAFKGDPTLEDISAFAAEKYKYTFDPQRPNVSPNSPAEQLAAAEQQQANVMSRTQAATLTNEQIEAANKANEKFLGSEPVTQFDIAQGIAAKMQAVNPQ